MRQVGSRYVLESSLGYGASGQVWRGRVVADGTPVAVKVLHPALAHDPDVVSRFVRERSVLTGLHSEHLVAVHDLVVEGDTLAIVMDLVEGPDLRRYVRTHPELPPGFAADMTAQALAALEVVHQGGIVHRDLKPENILVRELPNGSVRALLTDFGIARLNLGPTVTRSNTVVGTPTYMSPEVAELGKATPASDIYAAGVVLYELLAGRPPFRAQTAIAMLRAHVQDPPPPIPDLPAPIWEVVSRMLAKKPTDRYRSARQAAAALAEAIAGDEPEPTQEVATPAAADVPGEPTTEITRRPTVDLRREPTVDLRREPTVERPRPAPPSPVPPPPRAPEPGPARRRRTGLVAAAVGVPALVLAGIVGVLAWPDADDGGGTGGTSQVPVSLATTGPWGGLQHAADTWSSVVPPNPGEVGDDGQACRVSSPISPFSNGKITCKFPDRPDLVILTFASAADLAKRIAYEEDKSYSGPVAWTIRVRPERSTGTRVVLAGRDQEARTPFVWWAYEGQDRYALSSSWAGHTPDELREYWTGFDPL